LCLGIDFQHISGESIPRIISIPYNELCLFYLHLDDLVVDGGIIEISSQQKEDQHRTHDIIIED
jgi:hypothetical protein